MTKAQNETWLFAKLIEEKFRSNSLERRMYVMTPTATDKGREVIADYNGQAGAFDEAKELVRRMIEILDER